MDLKSKSIIKSLIGFILGVFVGLMFSAGYDALEINTYFLVHLLLSGVLGAVCMGSTGIYDIESWGILRSTLTHYALCMGTFVVIALVLGWFEGNLPMLLIFIVIMTGIYALIWIFESLYWRRTVRRMNARLKAMKEEQ